MGWLNIFKRAKPLTEEEIAMKYLICGLGNPGAEYESTRHNAGFEIVDELVNRKNGHFKDERHGWVAHVKHKGRTLVVLKPSTYMNLSGKAVRYWIQKESIKIPNVLVIVDDLNIPFGTVRLRKNGKDGGHNGLKDINQVLGHNNYARLRVGIGNEFGQGQQVDYVLGGWSKEELKVLPKIIDHTVKTLESFTVVGANRAMNQANKNVID